MKNLIVEPILLSTVRLYTYLGSDRLTNASGFFYKDGERLFLVTSRHVLIDEPSQHYPDRLVLEIHDDVDNLASSTGFSILLYKNEKSIWRDAADSSSSIDVAIIEIDKRALPEKCFYYPFTRSNLISSESQFEIGSPLLVIGYPFGFHDTLHHLPVARQASVASSFGLRFQGQSYFLTDARTHRGSSGAPVVARKLGDDRLTSDLPWTLLGIHSSRFDMISRDMIVDEALGLNCTWYADVILTLIKAPASFDQKSAINSEV